MPVPLVNVVRPNGCYTLGADLNWQPDYAHGSALDAATGRGTRQDNVIAWLRSLGAQSAEAPKQR